MRSILHLPLLLAALATTTAALIERRCSAPEPDAALVAEAALQDADEAAGRSTPDYKPIAINTHFHVVSTPAHAYDYTSDMLSAQLAYMNEAYNPWNVSFVLKSTDYTVNAGWAKASYGSKAEYNMKYALRKGGYADLNLYFLSNLGDGLLGFCYFPAANPNITKLTLDGCTILSGSLPGGGVPTYDLGGTAAHETGHWLGLFHVFQGRSCDGPGDFIGDTPVQKNATRGCPASADSCPGKKGLDSIHNYMDYSTDVCYEEFTQGQASRMHKMFRKYRS